MATRAISRTGVGRRLQSLPVAQFAILLGVVFAGAVLVSYLLWPIWPTAPVAPGVPAIPVTVAGVLFEVPPAAVRAAVQRRPGPHERIDLAFESPAMAPSPPKDSEAAQSGGGMDADAARALAQIDNRLFVTIAALGALLPPKTRLHTIYPRYLEARTDGAAANGVTANGATADAGPKGLAVLPFRAGTPYEGQDLVYDAAEPERFFALCTRQDRAVPGTCVFERPVDGADVTFRFPRTWLANWQSVAGGFDSLLAQLHPKLDAADSR